MENNKKKKVASKATTKKTAKTVAKSNTTKSKNSEIKKENKGEKTLVKEQVIESAKELKKKDKKKINIKEFLKSEYGSFIVILVILSVIALLSLLLADVIKNKDTDEDTVINDATIQYDEILLGSLLEQPNSTYYVLIYDSEDNYVQAYNSYISLYSYNDNAIRVYTSSINDAFNRSYISDSSNLLISNIKDLKVKETALVKVSNKTVVESYEGHENIINYLKQINE